MWRFACLLFLLFLANCQSPPRLRVVVQEVNPVIEAAAADLAARMQQAGYETEIATGPEASAGQVHAVILTVDESAPDLQPEGYRILPIRAGGFVLFRIIGKDPRGVLWGSQELAEQVISSGRLETVFSRTANRRLPLRAIGLPLRLPEASDPLETGTDPRDQWRERVGLLSRSRFNAIFLRATQPFIRFVPVPGEPGAPGTITPEMRAHREWLQELFGMARERGLECYLWITPASLEGWPSSPAEAEPSETVPAENPLANVLPAILGFYPELAGVALDPDFLPSDPSQRSRWIADNVLAPLDESDDHRPIFLNVGRDGWPSRDDLSAIAPDSRIRLLAPLPPPSERLPESDYPVLWRLEMPPSELRPWEDPGAAGAALQRISAQDSLGFLDASFLAASRPDSGGGSAARNAIPTFDDAWFHLLLLGRMGYSPDVSEEYWVQQFARRFGPRAGLSVYLAASRSHRILDLLPREDASLPFPAPGGTSPAGLTDFARQLFLLQSLLFARDESVSTNGVLAEILGERNWVLPAGPLQEEPFVTAAALEAEAREALVQAADAGRFGAWRDPVNQRLLHRIQWVTDAGLALGEHRRAALSFARFLLGGDEADRQQALNHLQSVRQRIAAQDADGSPEGSQLLARLQAQSAEAVAVIPDLEPWQWEKIAWEVGSVEEWNPLSEAEAPTPLQWTSAETSWLREFGLYGQQPWMTSLNQQLHPAFLTLATNSPLSPESLLVARTRISIPSSGQLILRVLSSQSSTIWVNGRPAAPLSPQQFTWSAGSPPPPPLRVQLFAQRVPPGNAEVVVSAPAAAKEAPPQVSTQVPMIALHSLFVSEARVPIQISAPDATELAGGVQFIPATPASPQPHLALAGEQDVEASTDTARGNRSQAVFQFSLREPGFYRVRLWSFWETSPRLGFDLSLDGSSFSREVGRSDPIAGRWHWVSVGTVAALGPGDHRLAVTGWSAATHVGIVEISQQDAAPAGP